MALSAIIFVDGNLNSDEAYNIYKKFYEQNVYKDNLESNKYSLLFGYINYAKPGEFTDEQRIKVNERVMELYPEDDTTRYDSLTEVAFKSQNQRDALNEVVELSSSSKDNTAEVIGRIAFFAKHVKEGFGSELKQYLATFVKLQEQKQSFVDGYILGRDLEEIKKVIEA